MKKEQNFIRHQCQDAQYHLEVQVIAGLKKMMIIRNKLSSILIDDRLCYNVGNIRLELTRVFLNISKESSMDSQSLFFQSMPYVVVTLIATIMYQQHGMTNTQTALLTSLFMLPWTIKPLFAPFLENLATKKKLTLYTQATVTLLFIILTFCVENPNFLVISSLSFAALAFVSSLHDIVSDGIYLLNLNCEEQKRYVALRSFFYQMGRLIIKGGLLALIGSLALNYELKIWPIFFFSLFIIGFLLTLYHKARIPENQTKQESINPHYGQIFKTLLFHTSIYPILFFIFLYNFSEAQMQKIIPLFLLDRED